MVTNKKKIYQDLVFPLPSNYICKRQKVNIFLEIGRTSTIYRADVAVLPTSCDPPVRLCLCCCCGDSGGFVCGQGTVPATWRIWLPCRAVGEPFLYQPGCALRGSSSSQPQPPGEKDLLSPSHLPPHSQNEPHWGSSHPQPLPCT